MPNAKRDEDVIHAASQLEHAVKTSIEAKDESCEGIIVKHLIDDICGTETDWDLQARDRVKWAYDKLIHALNVRMSHLSEHDDVVELEVVAVREGGVEGIALKAGNHMLIIDGPQILEPITINPGDTLQVRLK